MDLTALATALEWILCDVDGVLTDGRLWYDRDGEALKAFHVRDGLALKLARRSGLKVGLLTSRSSQPLDRRIEDLGGLDEVMTGRRDKAAALDDFLQRRGVAPRRVAYIGDDLPDLAVLGRVGLGFAPADAAPEVRAAAHRVLDRPGGGGAVREMVELILAARGEWSAALAPFSFER